MLKVSAKDGDVEITGETLDSILGALEEQLQVLGTHQEIVVIGGSALTALGLVRRATKDVDVVAIAEGGELRPASPLPEALREARDRVARDFDLDPNWLNAGTTGMLKWGLPEGFMNRVSARRYGNALVVHLPADSTRFISSSLRWLIKLEGATRRTCERCIQASRNSSRRRAGQ